ncbi:hypothetical protein QBC32DRAFT_224972, partial [Pseudoneurospora amorphoporcata]
KCFNCLANKPTEEMIIQIRAWAAQGILTCTDCMKRPQRAPGKLCAHCFKARR